MLSFTPTMSKARDALVSGIPVLKFFCAVGQRDPFELLEEVERDLLEQGYAESTASVPEEDRYRLMVNPTAQFPTVLLLQDPARIYAVAFERHDKTVVEEFLTYALRFGMNPELASVEIAAKRDRSVVAVSYATDKDPRRDLIDAVALTTKERALRSNMILTNRDGRARVEFEILGKGHEQAAQDIRERINSLEDIEFDEDSVHTTEPLQTLPPEEVSSLLRKVRAKLTARSLVQNLETAGVFDDAAVAVGDRVIINDGTAREPVYLPGTVETVYPGRRRIDVRLDSSKLVTEQIDNKATGMLGFQRGSRQKSNPILEIYVAQWLDRDRWMSAHARALVARISK